MSTRPAAANSAASTVYAVMQEATSTSGGGSSVPAHQLYKVAREEELNAFRGLCRVLVMHYGSDALASTSASTADVRYKRRLLEDLQDALCISTDRCDLEVQAAAQDDFVRGVHRAGVLRRRQDFFDGVEDVPLTATRPEEGRAQDDGHAPYAPALKEPRAEGGRGAPATLAGGRAGSDVQPMNSLRAKAARKRLLASVTEIGQDVERSANTLLYSDDQDKASTARDRLVSNRQALEKLKAELAETA